MSALPPPTLVKMGFAPYNKKTSKSLTRVKYKQHVFS